MLRHHYKKLRESFGADLVMEWSQLLSLDLLRVLRDRCFDGVLFLYTPTAGEPDLLSFSRNYRCHLALPIVIGPGVMEFRHWVPGDRLQRGPFGIMGPSEDAVPISPRPGDGIVVPALSIDRKGSRLGFGGGYYDRFLRGHRHLFLFVAGCVFPPCLTPDELPTDERDQSVDFCLKISQDV